MGDLTKNFNRSEFHCKCATCDNDTIDYETLMVLQNVRDYFGKSIKVTSGYRCSYHNNRIGGSKQSQHMKGRAADIKVRDIEPEVVYNYINDNFLIDKGGVILYDTFVHVDSRNKKYRADKRTV